VVPIRIAIDDEGRVARIRMKPDTDPAFKKAVADAVKEWVFKLRPNGGGIYSGKYSMSRLTFNFVSGGGQRRVELYKPDRYGKERDYLGGTDTQKESREWKRWEEVPIDR
jgi:hypothetical protein